MTFWISIGTILPLLLISAFLSGSETALTVASRGRLFHMSGEGSLKAQAALGLLERPDQLLGAILIGNNLVNVLAASLATFALVRVFGESGVAIASLSMTALIVVFSEIAPKTYAIGQPETAALRVALPIRTLVYALSPILRMVRAITRGVLGLFGVSADPDKPVFATQEEIRGAIDLGHKSGAFVKRHRDMLLAALELEHADVSEVMTSRRNVDMLDGGAHPEKLLDVCVASSHTRLPIWRNSRDSIVGVVHIKDLFRAVHDYRRNSKDNSLEGFDVLRVASSPWFVPENRSLSDQLRAFQTRKNKLALVVDEYGDFQGVVTLEDVLEDIVGDISDEHDLETGAIDRQQDGSYLVDGTVTIRSLNRICDWSLPDEPATTIAGLVIHEARTIPAVGRVFSFHGFRFEIAGREGNRITKLLIRAPKISHRI